MCENVPTDVIGNVASGMPVVIGKAEVPGVDVTMTVEVTGGTVVTEGRDAVIAVVAVV